MQLEQEPQQEGALRRKLRALFALTRGMLSEIVHIMWRLPSEPVELILSIEAIGFGLVLAGSRQVFGFNPGFAAMAIIASQDTWALVAGLLGSALLCALMLRNVHVRRWCLLAMFMFWMLVSTQIAFINISTGVSTYGGLAVAAAIAHLRLDLRRGS